MPPESCQAGEILFYPSGHNLPMLSKDRLQLFQEFLKGTHPTPRSGGASFAFLLCSTSILRISTTAILTFSVADFFRCALSLHRGRYPRKVPGDRESVVWLTGLLVAWAYTQLGLTLSLFASSPTVRRSGLVGVLCIVIRIVPRMCSLFARR